MQPKRTNSQRINLAIGLILQAGHELKRIESDKAEVFDPVFLAEGNLIGIAESLRSAKHFEDSNHG